MIGERIKAYRKSMGLKVVEFAKLAEISQGSLSGIENLKTKPSSDTIEAIVRNTDINPIWLLTGKGAMGRTSQAEIAKTLNALVDQELLEAAIELSDEVLEEIFQQQGKKATTKQRAQFILALYDLASEREDHKVDRPTALWLVKRLAA
jgi:transcriptional regulator with XRE-family HTH domain